MIDGSFNYARHSDKELSDCLFSINSEQQPLNTKKLAEEIERRWLREKEAALQSRTDIALAKGARFDELHESAARRFFWPYFWYGSLLSIGMVFVALALTYILGFGFLVLVGLSGGGKEFAVGFAEYAYPVSLLIMAVPYARFVLRKVTGRSFGGYVLRIMRPESDVESNKLLQPIAPKDGAPVER